MICDGELKFLGPRRGELKATALPREYKYYVCHNCGTIQLNPMPTPEEMAVLYQDCYLSENNMERSTSPETWKEASRTYNESILKELRRHVIGGPVLDFGAGYGFLCQLLNKNGYECTGVELSDQRLVYCRQNNMPVQKGGPEVFHHKQGLSAVLMCAVFEHLSAHLEFLKQASKGLGEGGIIITLHPTSKVFRLLAFLLRFGMSRRELPHLAGAFAPPWHTMFVSISGMKLLAERAGLQVCNIRPAPQGRLEGVLGFIQACLEAINRIGWLFFGAHWPLHTSHIFVLKRRGSPVQTTANADAGPIGTDNAHRLT
jgi:SAM-dependent methyltransferase